MVCSKVCVFFEGCTVLHVVVHGVVKGACKEFTCSMEAVVEGGGKAGRDRPLVFTFRNISLWVAQFGAWMISAH